MILAASVVSKSFRNSGYEALHNICKVRRSFLQSLQATDLKDLEALVADLGERWGQVDGVLHAIAFAPEDALGGKFLTAPPESAAAAFQTSAFSLKALAAALADQMVLELGRTDGVEATVDVQDLAGDPAREV